MFSFKFSQFTMKAWIHQTFLRWEEPEDEDFLVFFHP